jgi:hypothetical protein
MYAVADKYQAQILMHSALQKFRDCLGDHWNTPDFVQAVSIVFSSTPNENRDMRNAVFDAFRKHVQVDISQIPGVEERLGQLDEFTFHLLKSWPQNAKTT